MQKPYIKKIGNLHDISIFIVDGQYIRTSIDEDFTNFGTRGRHDFIPANEFWIDRECSPESEQRFYIDHMLAERRYMNSGKTYNEAVDLADRIERRERLKANNVKRVAITEEFIEEKVHRMLLHKYSTLHLKVWLVRGKIVRDFIDVDFAEGGHDKVYSYIPSGEVWIDDDLVASDRRYILLHELVERNLMSRGHPYWMDPELSVRGLLCAVGIIKSSHKVANAKECYYRHHPDKIDKAIAHELSKIMA